METTDNQNETNNENDKVNKNAGNEPTKKTSKIWGFIKNNKFYALLIGIIVFLLIWHFYKISSIKNDFQLDKTTLVKNYEIKLDSLNTNRLQLTAKTFSWAIRSELLRNNADQVNLFFNDFIKTPDVIKLQYINADTNLVEVSTDKKDEGTTNTKFSNLEDQQIISDSLNVEIATPISGLNKKMGVFIMEIKNLN